MQPRRHEMQLTSYIERFATLIKKCDISSVGRAIPCQGIGHRFEPDMSLQILIFPIDLILGKAWRDGRMAMLRIANPPISVRLRVAPPQIC
jgi:hypothetical protein